MCQKTLGRGVAARNKIRSPKVFRIPLSPWGIFYSSPDAQRREVFYMQKQKGLRNVRVLATAAMLGALSVVIGIFCKNFLNFGNGLFRVTFENFPIILSGILFGPAVGASVGIISDMVSYFLSTQSFAISRSAASRVVAILTFSRT